MARRTTAGTDLFTTAARDIAISDDGTVATHSGPYGWKYVYPKGVTGGEVLVAGTGKKDYWEVTLTADPGGDRHVFIGVTRPGLDLEKKHYDTDNAWYFFGYSGTLCGNGKSWRDPQGRIAVGDRIGMLLDWDAGSLRFYRNGQVYGPGFPSGVTGPLVRTVEFSRSGIVVTLNTSASIPA